MNKNRYYVYFYNCARDRIFLLSEKIYDYYL